MSPMPRRATVLAVLAIALLAGCASAPPPVAGGAAARDYFPLLPGTHWVYQLKMGFFTHTTLDVTARGSRPVRGSDARIFVVEERTEQEVFGLDPMGLVGYQVANGFVRRVPAVQMDPDGIVHVFGRDGIQLLPTDPQPGQHWDDEVAVFDVPNATRAKQSWTARVEKVGSVHVAAGRFEDVIVVISEQWDRDWKEDEPLHSYEDYYARGVGLIRSVARNHTRLLPFADLEQELTSVSFDEGAGASIAR
jgi:hypothetical protein